MKKQIDRSSAPVIVSGRKCNRITKVFSQIFDNKNACGLNLLNFWSPLPTWVEWSPPPLWLWLVCNGELIAEGLQSGERKRKRKRWPMDLLVIWWFLYATKTSTFLSRWNACGLNLLNLSCPGYLVIWCIEPASGARPYHTTGWGVLGG